MQMHDDDHTLKTPDTGNREPKTKSASDLQFSPGDIIAGVYQVISFIGAGGMSNVYKCRDISLDRIVAVKALQTGYTADSLRRFQTEGKAVARLEHQHIVKLYGLQTSEDGEPVLVMEYITGHTLSDVLKRNPGRLPIDRVLNITEQICDALTMSEREGIVHRDLKPSNIMLTEPGTPNECVKILDFGIAKIRDSANHDATKTGDIFGTPNYMSPEQALGKKCDARADQYALGCILFEMLSGRPPFTSENILSVILMHVQNPVPNVTEVTTKHLPTHLAQIVRKMMQKKPDDRFANFPEVAKALETVGQKNARDARKLALYSVVPIIFIAILVALFYRMHTHDANAPNRGRYSVAPPENQQQNSITSDPAALLRKQITGASPMSFAVDASNQRLNNEFAKVIRKYQGVDSFKPKLKAAELAWISYRDAHLKSLYPGEDQSDGASHSSCYDTELMIATAVRETALRALLKKPSDTTFDKNQMRYMDGQVSDLLKKALKRYVGADPKLLQDSQDKYESFRKAEAEMQATLANKGDEEAVRNTVFTRLAGWRKHELDQWVEDVRESNKDCAGTRQVEE